jgi:tetratricopeptide (TPR) repeat protein
MARIALAQGDLAAMRRFLDESVPILRAEHDTWGLTFATMWQGHIAALDGDVATARALYLEAANVVGARAIALAYLGYLACRQGDLHEARVHFEACLRIWRQAPDPWSLAWGLEGLAGLLGSSGQALPAAQLYGAAAALLEHTGSRLDPFDRMDYDRNVAATREQLDPSTFAEAWSLGRAMPMDEALAYALHLVRTTAPPEPP